MLEHLKARAAAVRDRDPDKGAAALLLLDNVSESELLSAAQLATLPGGMSAGWLRIIATTRLDLREQKDRLALLEVHSLDEETALSLIRDHQPPRQRRRHAPRDEPNGTDAHDLQHTPQFASDAEEAAAREIVRALGGFTLAVVQVALYLGLHPEVTPSSFLATLRERGLPVADTLPVRDPDVAAQMLTQSKQLGLILDATLAMLGESSPHAPREEGRTSRDSADTTDPQSNLPPSPATGFPHAEREGYFPAITALQFAALLPPDSVPWPWLRALTVARLPDLEKTDDLGADPWLAIQRRLTGLRLLTSGVQPEIARIHRLVAAHVGHVSNVPQPGSAKHVGNVLHDELIAFIRQRADQIYWSQAAPQPWELDALLVSLPIVLEAALPPDTLSGVANKAAFLSEKVIAYRNLPAAFALVRSCHSVVQRLAESDPANAAWQRDLWVSYWNVANLQEQLSSPEALATWRQAHDTLAAMIDNDLFVSTQDRQFLDRLRAKVGRP